MEQRRSGRAGGRTALVSDPKASVTSEADRLGSLADRDVAKFQCSVGRSETDDRTEAEGCGVEHASPVERAVNRVRRAALCLVQRCLQTTAVVIDVVLAVLRLNASDPEPD